MTQLINPTRVTASVGQNDITLETGRMANQADGSIVVSCGGTVVLVTACTQPLEFDKGFFPLVCDYQEMSYAAGRIPGSFFRREIGRPSEREVLVCRLMDRPHRPLFPKGFRDEVQLIATVLSADQYNNPDVLAVTGASAALTISKIPFMGPIAAARVGYIEGGFALNPHYEAMNGESTLNLIFAASRDAVVMVEGGAEFVSEDLIADALAWGHEQIVPLLDAQEELQEKVGKPKMDFVAPEENADVAAKVRELTESEIPAVLDINDKMERRDAKNALKKSVVSAVLEAWPDNPEFKGQASEVFGKVEKEIMRARIAKGDRIGGRDMKTVRPIEIEVGALPRTHGSTLFARGETKALAVATLGSTGDEQRIETLAGQTYKRWMLHYNFPPYCVGEVKMLRGPSRREIGHGCLAERAIAPVLPDAEEFPFTMRVVSEIMESNGSSSMASVCGASLSLMDAGVPVKAPVAGVAMGLIQEGDDYHILTDILGDEDHMGDMDFKVAGTDEGVTAIQMDIKITGLPSDVMRKALYQAKDARLHILGEMNKVLAEPRSELSPNAPQLVVVEVSPEKIRDIIGPGGKNIKAITGETGASIDIEDSGKVSIFAPTLESMEQAKEMVLFYDQKPELGKTYVGKVKKVIDCGAVVEILPSVEGLVHVSQLDVARVENVTDVVNAGDDFEVMVVEVQHGGRVRLSHKAVLFEKQGREFRPEDYAMSGGRGGGRRDDRRGGGRRDDRRGGGGGRR